MSKYLVKYDEWTEVSEQTGTIQNIDDGCPIEVSTTQVEGSGVILYPWEMKPFSNVQLYVRGYNKNPLPTEVRVVPFEVGQGGGGGGGSYVLPTATATRLGGVKIGQGITVAADGTISVNGAGIGTWAANTPYPVGIYVTYNDDLYLCTTAHTSTATFDDSKWKKIGGESGGIDFWTANTDYVLGDYVTYQNKLYLCTTAHTSSTRFAPTKWKEIGELPVATASVLGGVKIGQGITVASDGTISWSGIPDWTAETDYSTGEYVTHQNDLYLCTTAHTSTTAFDGTKWKLIGCDGCKIKEWAANTDYALGDYATYQNSLYLCTTAHTTGATFDSTKWRKIGTDFWEANTEYVLGDYVTYQNNLYLCTTAHTSGAAFDATKWTMIGDLPIATASTLGGVKIGAGINVEADGTISADGGISEWETAKAYAVGNYVTVFNYGRQEWQDDTAYSAGDFVTNDGNLYKCIVSHTAGSIFADDLSANKWVQVPRDGGLYVCVKAHTSDDFHDDFIVDGKWNAIRNGIDFWSTTKHYEVGQYVTAQDDYKRDEWQANTAYEIGDIVKLYNRGKSEWATGTSYAVGDYATMGKALYRCETAHTSSTFANDVAAGDWTLVDTIVEQFSCLDSHTSSGSFATDFGAGKWKSEMPKMETCICLQEHISDDFAANFAAGKWQKIGGIAKVMTGATSSANGASGLVPMPSAGDDDKVLFGDGTWKSAGAGLPEWQANTSYKAGEYLVHQGTVYKVVNAFTSGTTFSDTDLTPYISPLMKGATSSANGEAGMVPESTTADINKFLCGDGTWKSIGGVDAIKDTLWEGQAYTYQQVLNLTNNYADYDYIIVSIGKTKNDVFYSSFFEPSRGNRIRVYAPLPTISVDFKSGVTLSFSGSTATIMDYLNVGGGTDDIKLVAIVGIKFINPNVYSTTEQRIGTWIDGKPLYQITLTGTTPSSYNSQYNVYDLTPYSIDNLVSYNGYFTTSYNHNFNINIFINSQRALGFYPQRNGATMFFGCLITGSSSTASDFVNCPFTVTIKYTKT